MSSQINRIAYVPGKGGFLRILWKPSIASESTSLVVLPSSTYTWEYDPKLENMTEADSLGELFLPTLASMVCRVDLRRRYDPMSLDALGLTRGVGFIEAYCVDVGNSGKGYVVYHAAVGPYNFQNPQIGHVTEGFSLMGGQLQSGGAIAIPTNFQLGSTFPNIGAYVGTGSLPSGL